MPPRSTLAEVTLFYSSNATSETGAIRIGRPRKIEALRRETYLRLAWTVGLSSLDCRGSCFRSR